MQVKQVSSVLSDQPCDARTCCSAESVMYPPAVVRRLADACQSSVSFRSVYRSPAHNSVSTTTEHHLRTLHHVLRRVVVVAELTRRSTRGCHRLKIHQSACLQTLPSATCRRTRFLFTEHTDTQVSRSRSASQGFIRNLAAQFQRSPTQCPKDH